MADIFTEVDEDLRREKLEKAWKKFGPYIITGAVLFIAVIAGRVFWTNYEAGQRIEQSEHYRAALSELAQGRQESAIEAFQTLASEGKHGYDLLAGLQAAGLLLQEGKVEESLAAYDAIAANGDYEQRYRDYAAFFAGMVTLDQMRYDEARARLEPLAVDGNPWASSARELLGLMALEQGNWAEAEATFLALSISQDAPVELRTRAGEYLQILDVKKPKTPLNEAETLEEPVEPVAQEDDPEEGQ